MVAWVLFALAIGLVRCDQSASKPRQLWDIKVDSLSDAFKDNSDHKVFVGSFQKQFGYDDCFDVCDTNSRTKCAANTEFTAKRLSFDSTEWVWSSNKIKAGSYSAMIALDPSCWDRRGRISQNGKNLEAVPFVVPSIGSEVVISYHADVEVVTVTIHPLVENFACHGLEPYLPDWEFYGDCELIKLADSSPEGVEKYNTCIRRGTPADEYNKYFRPVYGSGGSTDIKRSCDDPSMMVGNYTLQVLGARNVPALEFLDFDLSDPFVEFTLPKTDPRGRWVSGSQSNCATCDFDNREDMILRLGMKVGGSELKMQVRDKDVGFEVFNIWEDVNIGQASTRLMGCSFNMLRTDAVCGSFDAEYKCANWKPFMHDSGGGLFDYTKTCFWSFGECRGCEVFETKPDCLNGGCSWDRGMCHDVCRQDAWVALNNGNKTAGSSKVTHDPKTDKWTFGGDAGGTTYIKVRQVAQPFTARILKVDVENTHIGVAAASQYYTTGFKEPTCPNTNPVKAVTDEDIKAEEEKCDDAKEGRNWKMMRKDMSHCLDCDQLLDYTWRKGQGQGYGDDKDSITNAKIPQFKNLAGGIILQTPNKFVETSAGSVVYAKRLSSPLFMQFQASHDFRAMVFRAAGFDGPTAVSSTAYPNGGDMDRVPTWLQTGVRNSQGLALMESGAPLPKGLDGGWKKTTRYDLTFDEEGKESKQVYVAFYRDFKGNDKVYLGGSAYGLGLKYESQQYVDGGAPKKKDKNNKTIEVFSTGVEFPDKMYVVVLRGRVEVTTSELCDAITINYGHLVTVSLPFFLLFLPAVVLVWWFLHHKLRYRLDRIPSYLASLTLSDKDKKKNILGAILLAYYDENDPTHKFFRRSMYWTEVTIWVLLCTPLAIWTSWSCALIIAVAPVTIGLFCLCFGNAAMISLACVLQWRSQGWRMTRGIQFGMQISFALLLVYLMAAALMDPCGMSFFGITAAHLVVNMVLMVYVNFLNSHHVEDAFVEIDSHSTDHDAVMASIMASLGEDTQHASGLRGYLESCYTIDNMYDSFSMVDELNSQTNGEDRKLAVKRNARTLYFVAVAVLILYLAISRFFLTDQDVFAFANVCTVLFLDATVPLLQQGNLTWSPLFTSALMLLSRVVITAFAGDFWIAGHSLAYFVFSVAISTEIVNQRLPQVSGLDAGAAAFFDRNGDDKTTKSRKDNIASSPEVVFGYIICISVMFLVFGNYAVSSHAEIVLLSSSWPVWSVGVGLVIVNIEILLILATVRSLQLYTRNLLETDAYCCVPEYRLPFLLATALVIYTVLAGVLLTLFTGSTMFVVFAFFVPLILITGGYSWTQYFRNDCAFTLTQLRRMQEINRDRMAAQRQASAKQQEQQNDEEMGLGGGGGAGSSPFHLPVLGNKKGGSLSKLKMPKLPVHMPSPSKAESKTESEAQPLIIRTTAEPEPLKDEHDDLCTLYSLFWNGSLSRREYFTIISTVALCLLVIAWGVTFAFVERPWWFGACITLGLFFLVCVLGPIQEFTHTGKVTCMMGFLLFIAMLLLAGILAIVGATYWTDITNPLLIWLVAIAFWVPEGIVMVFTFASWLDNNFEVTNGINCSFNFFVFSLAAWGVVVTFWSLNFYVIVAYILLCGFAGSFFVLAKAWADNEQYLAPKWRRRIVYVVIAALIADIAMMILIPLISGLLKQPTQVDLLFCMSIFFLLIAFLLMGNYVSTVSFAPKNSSIIFTQHVFPVYMYDPVKVRIDDISSAVWCMLATFLVVVCWGTVASIYFVPVNFGVSIIGLALILLQLFLAHATHVSPVQLAKSLRCSDHVSLKSSAMRAEEVYQFRRSKYVVHIPEKIQDARIADQTKTEVDAMLAKYSEGRHGHAKKEQEEKKTLDDFYNLNLDELNLANASKYAREIETILNDLYYIGAKRFPGDSKDEDEEAEPIGESKTESKTEPPPKDEDPDSNDRAARKLATTGWYGDCGCGKERSCRCCCMPSSSNDGNLKSVLSFVFAALFVTILLLYTAWFVAGYAYTKSAQELMAQMVSGIVLVAIGFFTILGTADHTKPEGKEPSPFGLYSTRVAWQEVWRQGYGPLGFLTCGGCCYKIHKKVQKKSSEKAGKYSRVRPQSKVPLPALPESLKRFRGKSEKQKDAAAVKLDVIETLKDLVKLDHKLSMQFMEEQRALALFQALVIASARQRVNKEGVLFQKFLREQRYKLNANGILLPKSIFTSKSYATVDVNLVANWVQHLPDEQHERYRQLKARFNQEMYEAIQQQIAEDTAEAREAENLLYDRANREYEMNVKRYNNFKDRRARRVQENRANITEYDKLLDRHVAADEVELNALERLDEIMKGADTQPGKHGRAKQFVDPEFLRDENSIGECDAKYSVVGWRGAHTINIDCNLFTEGSDPDDVFQGDLQNQWLLAAISMVAASGGVGDNEIDPLIDHLFISKDDHTGAYAIRLWKNSQWEAVIVDDYFPVKNDSFRTHKSHGVAFGFSENMQELWVPLLEKAFAKYYGNYAELEKGYVQHGLTDLTGAVTETIYLAQASQGAGKLVLWKQLMLAYKDRYILGAGSITGTTASREVLDEGIIMNASYLIYDVREIGAHKLLKLRNPPDYGEGAGEWKGDWSDNSRLWTKRTKNKLGYVNNEDDKQFWMSFDDFCVFFRCVYVCKYHDPERWQKARLQGYWKKEDDSATGLPSPKNPKCDLKKAPQYSLYVSRPTDVVVKLSQTEFRMATQIDPPHYMAIHVVKSQKRVMQAEKVDKLNNINIMAHTEDSQQKREIICECTLEPGFYAVLCTTILPGQESPFEVEVTCNHPTTFEAIDGSVKTSKEKIVESLVKAKEGMKKTKSKLNKNFKDATGVDVEKLSLVAADAIAGTSGMDFVDAEVDEGEFDWVKQTDPNTKTIYYYNLRTKASVWEPPPEWDEEKGKRRLRQMNEEKAAKKAEKKRKKAEAKRLAQQNSSAEQKTDEAGYAGDEYGVESEATEQFV